MLMFPWIQITKTFCGVPNFQLQHVKSRATLRWHESLGLSVRSILLRISTGLRAHTVLAAFEASQLDALSNNYRLMSVRTSAFSSQGMSFTNSEETSVHCTRGLKRNTTVRISCSGYGCLTGHSSHGSVDQIKSSCDVS